MLKLALLSVLTFGSVASANPVFTDARVFIPLKGGRATAGYANVKNDSKKAVQVTAVAVQGFKAAELHETFEKDGKMGMKRVDVLQIAPGETLELKPGGKHIMLFDPSKEFTEGQTLNLDFTVDGKVVAVPFKLIPRVAK